MARAACGEEEWSRGQERRHILFCFMSVYYRVKKCYCWNPPLWGMGSSSGAEHLPAISMAWVQALPPQKPNQMKLSHDLYTNSGSPMLETHFCQVGYFRDNLNLNFSLSFSSRYEFGYYISLWIIGQVNHVPGPGVSTWKWQAQRRGDLQTSLFWTIPWV